MKHFSILTAAILGGFSQFATAQTIVGTTPTNRTAVLQEYTGIHCTWCPAGHLIASNMKASNPNSTILINVHAGGFATPASGELDFRTSVGTALDDYFAPAGYPAGDVNRQPFNDNDDVAGGRGVWSSRATTVRGQVSPVNVGARCTINLDTRQLRMAVEAYYTAAGTGTGDKFHAFILQNNIAGTQTGDFRNPNQILPDGRYNHMHALRAAITPNWGSPIANNAMGALYTNNYTYTIPANYANIPALLGDLEVVVFVTDDSSYTYTGAEAEIYYETSNARAVQPVAIASNLEYNASCSNSFDPTLTFTNMGADDISSLTVQYTNNGGAAQTAMITLSTPVATADRVMFDVPNVALSTGANALSFTVTEINGQAYSGSPLNINVSTAAGVASAEDSLRFNITFDNYPEEVSYVLVDETAGTTVASQSFTNAIPDGAVRSYSFPLINGHCYKFAIRDVAGDGICCGYGNGSFTLTSGNATVLTSNGSYAGGTGHKFTWVPVVGVENIAGGSNARLYPNPANEQFTLEFELAEATDMNIQIQNALGQVVRTVSNGNMNAGLHQLNINSSDLAVGTYFVTISQNGKTSTQKFNVLR